MDGTLNGEDFKLMRAITWYVNYGLYTEDYDTGREVRC
jgi:hypothetical protein